MTRDTVTPYHNPGLADSAPNCSTPAPHSSVLTVGIDGFQRPFLAPSGLATPGATLPTNLLSGLGIKTPCWEGHEARVPEATRPCQGNLSPTRQHLISV